MTAICQLASQIEERLSARNPVMQAFFDREAHNLADACRQMSDRFLRGGRLLAFGRGPYATDAQHVSVEFVHPVIVGKRALPALDLSIAFRPWLDAIVSPDDIVMGFGPPEGDPEVWSALDDARKRGAMTFALPAALPSALPGTFSDKAADYSFRGATTDPFIHQELVEILYHTLWETVHVFFERRELGHDVGAAGFLYPFLGQEKQSTTGVMEEVAHSILLKVNDDAVLRTRVAREQAEQIGNAALAMFQRISAGGKLILFGNGGSATDANDWSIDCICPPPSYKAVPAVSLSLEPANITAIANDVGTDVIFLRQFIAQARSGDVAVAISTSGGSKNVIMALEEARKRNMLTVALLGYDGGEIRRRGLADFPIVVQSDYIPRIQEIQASIYHVMREMLEVLRHAQT